MRHSDERASSTTFSVAMCMVFGALGLAALCLVEPPHNTTVVEITLPSRGGANRDDTAQTSQGVFGAHAGAAGTTQARSSFARQLRDHGRGLGGRGGGRGRGRGGRGRLRRRDFGALATPPPPMPPPLETTTAQPLALPKTRPAAGGGRRRRQQRDANEQLARKCDAFEPGDRIPAECMKPLPCDLRAFDPGAKFNRAVIAGRYGRERKWAQNNVDPATRHFQNGMEWWVHRALSHVATTSAEKLGGAKRVFVAAYYSYLFIFAPHLAQPAARAAEHALGRASSKHAVVHGHPGSCIRETRGALRLVVDADLSCADSARTLAVPYVVSRPAWLVAEHLPKGHERTTLLFARYHLPRSSIDTRNVRRILMRALAGQPGVVIEAATAARNASYQPHGQYLRRMLRSTFCLAPRGDTASSRRVYESIAAGCIPVIIADDLALPFATRLRYEDFTLRFKEREALAKPLAVLQQLRSLPPQRIRRMQRALLKARPSFLWHTDPSRESAVDQILRDMCEAAD